MASVQTVHALNRFGLGARPEEHDRIGDPRAWLSRQLTTADLNHHVDRSLPTSAAALSLFRKSVQARKAEAKMQSTDATAAQGDLGRAIGQDMQALYRQETVSRMRAAVLSDAPFRERLVQFWSNHFTVSMQNKLVVAPVAGAYEREAIRPHIMGSFGTLLKAAVQHPAMLLYLDNAQSIGPNSRAGRRVDRGLNENLAREILELHTLGVNGGYVQADVTSFAKVLTGWTVGTEKHAAAKAGQFVFQPLIHEPGSHLILGKRYAEDGLAQGEAVLRDLARHPSTANFIATKLARHFAADDPPHSLVTRLAETFRTTEGDLPALYRVLIDAPETWATPLAKLKTPNDFLISTLRGLELDDVGQFKLVESFALLGQRPFFAPSPAGWPDDAQAWAGPDAIKKRLEYAHTLAERLGSVRDARRLGAALLGPLLSSRTNDALVRAASAAQGLTLLLMSPEFQRR